MANMTPTDALRLIHTENTGFMDHAIIAPICGLRYRGAGEGVALLSMGLAQGRIVSITRGSPPLKKR